MTLTVD